MTPPTCCAARSRCCCRASRSSTTSGCSTGATTATGSPRPAQGREVNRHVYDDAELAEALARTVPRALLALARLRRDHPAFDGEFSWERLTETSLRLGWRSPDASLELDAQFAPASRGFALRSRVGEREWSSDTVAELATAHSRMTNERAFPEEGREQGGALPVRPLRLRPVPQLGGELLEVCRRSRLGEPQPELGGVDREPRPHERRVGPVPVRRARRRTEGPCATRPRLPAPAP